MPASQFRHVSQLITTGRPLRSFYMIIAFVSKVGCYTSTSNSFPRRRADVGRLYTGGLDQAISRHCEGKNVFTIKGILRHASRLGIETKIEVKAYQSHRSSFHPMN